MDPTQLGLPPTRVLCGPQQTRQSTLDDRDDIIRHRHELPHLREFPLRADRLPMGSVAATLEFAETQRKARVQGKPNWRELELDGSLKPITQPWKLFV